MNIGMRTTPQKQLERARVEGWDYSGDMSTEGEVLEFLYGLVRIEKPEIVVETGTYQALGTSAIYTAMERNGAFNHSGALWTVEKEDAFKYNPKPGIHFIHADSVEWTASDECPEWIDWAFIDCGPPDVRIHAFENVWRRMRYDGMIVTHDTEFYDGGFLAAFESIAGRPLFHFKALNGVTAWRKDT